MNGDHSTGEMFRAIGHGSREEAEGHEGRLRKHLGGLKGMGGGLRRGVTW